jgi:uncharacterized protein
MPGLLQRFLPRDDDYFRLFVKQAENIHKGAKALCDLLSHYTAVPEQVQNIKAIEHAGDDIAHTIIMKLNQTVIDLIDAAASRFVLYRVITVRNGTADLAKILLEACDEVTALIQTIENRDEALKHCIEINRFENESDRLCRTLIAQLFDEETDPVQIIKWKEIFEVIETAVDKCEDVANVVESVVLKNA